MTNEPSDDEKRLDPTDKDDAGFFQPYAEFAKNLRTWFLAYGVGAPVLLISNQTAWTSVKDAGQIRLVSILFLLGVAIQITQALVYKHTMWHLYAGELSENHKKSDWHKVACWISESYPLELIIDLATMTLFITATIILFFSLA